MIKTVDCENHTSLGVFINKRMSEERPPETQMQPAELHISSFEEASAHGCQPQADSGDKSSRGSAVRHPRRGSAEGSERKAELMRRSLRCPCRGPRMTGQRTGETARHLAIMCGDRASPRMEPVYMPLYTSASDRDRSCFGTHLRAPSVLRLSLTEIPPAIQPLKSKLSDCPMMCIQTTSSRNAERIFSWGRNACWAQLRTSAVPDRRWRGLL